MAEPNESALDRGSISASVGPDAADAVTRAAATLDEWVRAERLHHNHLMVREEIERHLSAWSPEVLGLTGAVPDILIALTPPVVPVKVWGGSLGWPSRKRLKTWTDMMHRRGVQSPDPARGILLRCLFDPDSLLPHPIIPPVWALKSHDRYFPVEGPAAAAEFARVHRWIEANDVALQEYFEPTLAPLGLVVSARHYRVGRDGGLVDYCDLALLLSGEHSLEPPVGIASVWKGEAQLASLVRRVFPDAQRQYSPTWLRGQRLDIYVPSLKLAFEYQGKQHYEAVKYFGGDDGFRRNQERDRRKAARCRDEGVTLIEWSYRLPIEMDYLRRLIRQAGLPWPDTDTR